MLASDQSLRDDVVNLAIQRGDALISAGGQSLKWLIDLRPLLLRRDFLAKVAAEFWSRFETMPRLQVGGMETSAIPIVLAIVMHAPAGRGPVNGFIIRKDRKATGRGNIVEGVVTGDPIVLVDDTFNSGSSAEKSRAVLSAMGHSLHDMFVIVDFHARRGDAWRQLHRVDVRSMFELKDLGLELQSDPPPLDTRYRQRWHTAIAGGNAYHVVPKSAPMLVGDIIYRGSDAGLMQAFDARSGEIIWTFETTGTVRRKGIWSTPAIHDGFLYFGAYNGVLYCLDAKTGAEVWSQSCCEWIGSSPVVVPKHGRLYVGLEYARPRAQGSMAAFDLRTGDKGWEVETKKLQHGSAAYFEAADLLIWGSADHEMVACNAKFGDKRWTFATRRSVKYAPAIDEQRELAAFASFDKSIYLVNARTGEKLGEWPTGEICYTTPLFAAGRLFCGSGDRHLYVIDVDTRNLVAKLDLRARVYSSPRLIDGRVVVGTTGGRVIEIDPMSLEIKGVLQVPDAVSNAVAVTADGRTIFVSTTMNDLYAFERTSRAPAVPVR